MNNIRVIQIGVGSMGKRRIRNLKHIGINNIDCYDIKSDRVKFASEKYDVNPIYNLKDIDWKGYTHIIISTPPDIHMFYAKIGVTYELNTFIEASVVDDNINEVIDLYNKSNKKFLLAPSCTMRFDPIIIKTKEIIKSKSLGSVLNVNHYFGQYLPNWHPYEHISDFYVSKEETGAAREIVPFDLVYLIWLFGYLDNSNGYMMKTGSLGIGIHDIYSINAITSNNILFQMTIRCFVEGFLPRN